MLPAAYTAAAALYSSPLTSSALSFGAVAYLALSATPAQAATFIVRGSQANSGQLRGEVTVNANTNGASNEMALLKNGGVECGTAAAGDPSCPPPPPPPPAPPPPAPPPPAPPPPAPTPPASTPPASTSPATTSQAPTPPASTSQAPTPPAQVPTTSNQVALASTPAITIPGTTAFAVQPQYNTTQNATFLETLASSSGITSFLGLNPETTSQYLAHNRSVLTSMMTGDQSSSEVAIRNFTSFLSSLAPEQTTALIGITTFQAMNLSTSGQINLNNFTSFLESTSPYFHPHTTALGAQSSSSPLPYQTNATFIETFANSSVITSLIGTTLDINPETTSQYLAHNNSLLNSMMAGNKSSSEDAIKNLTTFLSSPQLTKDQATALIGITTSQVDYLNNSGQISNLTSSSFFESMANFTTNTSANFNTSSASANSIESKQDSPNLKFLGFIALLIIPFAIGAAIYGARERELVVPGHVININPAANADLIVQGGEGARGEGARVTA